jgi:hypothetical protein
LPLFLVYSSEEAAVRAAVDTVFISHNNPDPIAAAEFLSRMLYLHHFHQPLRRAASHHGAGALWRIIHHNTPLIQALSEAAALSQHQPIRSWLDAAIAKAREARDPSSALSRQQLIDDIAITSMARLWDVGKSEPIKVGKASPTEGALPAALYFALRCSSGR